MPPSSGSLQNSFAIASTVLAIFTFILLVLYFVFKCLRKRKPLQEQKKDSILIALRSGPLSDQGASADCPVCLQPICGRSRFAETICRHHFHFGCLRGWLSEDPHCPVCRHLLAAP